MQLEAPAARLLFGLPAHEAVDRVLPGDELGFGLGRLHEQLHAAPSFSAQRARN